MHKFVQVGLAISIVYDIEVTKNKCSKKEFVNRRVGMEKGHER